jgi:hypothetical protein
MADPAKSHTPTPGPHPPADLDSGGEHYESYSRLFQAWLILFLAVICFALVNYLISYIPR